MGLQIWLICIINFMIFNGMYKTILKTVIITVIVNASITASFAKYDSFKLGHAAGAYIAIND